MKHAFDSSKGPVLAAMLRVTDPRSGTARFGKPFLKTNAHDLADKTLLAERGVYAASLCKVETRRSLQASLLHTLKRAEARAPLYFA